MMNDEWWILPPLSILAILLRLENFYGFPNVRLNERRTL